MVFELDNTFKFYPSLPPWLCGRYQKQENKIIYLFLQTNSWTVLHIFFSFPACTFSLLFYFKTLKD